VGLFEGYYDQAEFSPTCIDLVMGLVSSVKHSVLLNGESEEYKPTRGIRQGIQFIHTYSCWQYKIFRVVQK
jgi:hypothetical protein